MFDCVILCLRSLCQVRPISNLPWTHQTICPIKSPWKKNVHKYFHVLIKLFAHGVVPAYRGYLFLIHSDVLYGLARLWSFYIRIFLEIFILRKKLGHVSFFYLKSFVIEKYSKNFGSVHR